MRVDRGPASLWPHGAVASFLSDGMTRHHTGRHGDTSPEHQTRQKGRETPTRPHSPNQERDSSSLVLRSGSAAVLPLMDCDNLQAQLMRYHTRSDTCLEHTTKKGRENPPLTSSWRGACRRRTALSSCCYRHRAPSSRMKRVKIQIDEGECARSLGRVCVRGRA